MVAVQHGQRGLFLGFHIGGTECLDLKEQSGEPFAGGVVDGCQRFFVEHLAGGYGSLLAQCHHCAARLGHIVEVHHCRGSVGLCLGGVEAYLADERQGALAANHAVGDDVERIFEQHERQQVQPRHVLDGVFVINEFGEFGVVVDFLTEGLYGADKLGMALSESGARFVIAGIEYGAVGEHYADGAQHAVAVGVRAALHAGGVIGDNAADHGAFLGCGIGREHTPERLQNFADASSYDTGLDGNAVGVRVEQTVFFPVFPGYHEDGIGDGLSGERRAGGSESDGQLQPRGGTQYRHNFLFVGGAHHHFGQKTVKTGVGAPCQAPQSVGVYPLAVHGAADVVDEPAVFRVKRGIAHLSDKKIWPATCRAAVAGHGGYS